ncbi:hypothetical protein QR680_018611 [Steinernema hermaphroditum]|uniref:Uncharacterized protein n=1 Tax=Steinernema hermaphroditum TaxID=289476 RepID=A0AA39LQL7_9BILA|nr:hypothetical protein QR680_018611 [Steinernema hermaphroditum]
MTTTYRLILRLAGNNRRFLCTKTSNPSPSASEKPLFVTKTNFERNDFKNRFSRAMDSSTGVRPTDMQKNLLVLTRMFKSRSDVPEYVAHGTMQRMRNRMRGVFLLVAVFVFHTIYKLF